MSSVLPVRMENILELEDKRDRRLVPNVVDGSLVNTGNANIIGSVRHHSSAVDPDSARPKNPFNPQRIFGDSHRSRVSESSTIPSAATYQAYESIQKNLSVNFTKKLDEWAKMRNSGTTSQRPSEHQIKKLPQDFTKKLQEWEKKKAMNASKSLSSAGGIITPSPKPDRKSTSAAAAAVRSQPKQELQSKFYSKEEKSSGKHSNKEKDMAWLEKELKKIEREKRRLEREKEKFLRREARLEQIKMALRTPEDENHQREILVRTASGACLRFGGISRSFARRLLEWEERQGISPEASAMALLHKPGKRLQTVEIITSKPKENSNFLDPSTFWNVTLTRSRSEGSIHESGNAAAVQATKNRSSTLSLDGIERHGGGSSRSHSEPDLKSSIDNARNPIDDSRLQKESCAIVVDVEELVEESKPIRPPALAAGILVEAPAQPPPLVTFCAPEVTDCIRIPMSTPKSSEGGKDRDSLGNGGKNPADRYSNLLDENINIIEQMQSNDALCKRIETQIEELQTKIEHVGWHTRELGTRKNREEAKAGEASDSEEEKKRLEDRRLMLKMKISELEAFHEKLSHDRENLKIALERYAAKQERLAQVLVGKIEELANVHGNKDIWQIFGQEAMKSTKYNPQYQRVDALSSELLEHARDIEAQLSARNREIRSLHLQLIEKGMHRLQESEPAGNCSNHHSRSWSSIEAVGPHALSKLLESSGFGADRGLSSLRDAHRRTSKQELSRKVRELKAELLKMWNSQDGVQPDKLDEDGGNMGERSWQDPRLSDSSPSTSGKNGLDSASATFPSKKSTFNDVVSDDQVADDLLEDPPSFRELPADEDFEEDSTSLSCSKASNKDQQSRAEDPMDDDESECQPTRHHHHHRHRHGQHSSTESSVVDHQLSPTKTPSWMQNDEFDDANNATQFVIALPSPSAAGGYMRKTSSDLTSSTSDRTHSPSKQSSDGDFRALTDSGEDSLQLFEHQSSSQQRDDETPPPCEEFFFSLPIGFSQGFQLVQRTEADEGEDTSQVEARGTNKRRISRDMFSRQIAFDDGRGFANLGKQLSGASEDTYKASDSPTGTTTLTLSRQNSETSTTNAVNNDGSGLAHRETMSDTGDFGQSPAMSASANHDTCFAERFNALSRSATEVNSRSTGAGCIFSSAQGEPRLIDRPEIVPTQIRKLFSTQQSSPQTSRCRLGLPAPTSDDDDVDADSKIPSAAGDDAETQSIVKVIVPTTKSFFKFPQDSNSRPPARRNTGDSFRKPKEPDEASINSLGSKPTQKQRWKVSRKMSSILRSRSSPAVPDAVNDRTVSPSSVRSMVQHYNRFLKGTRRKMEDPGKTSPIEKKEVQSNGSGPSPEPRRPPTLHLPPPPQPLPGMTSVSPEALMANHVRRTPSNRLRAWKIRRARDEFFAQGPAGPFSHYSRSLLPPSSPDDQLDSDALQAVYRNATTNPSFRRSRRPEPVAEENRYSTGSNVSSQSASMATSDTNEQYHHTEYLSRSASTGSLQQYSQDPKPTPRRRQNQSNHHDAQHGLPPSGPKPQFRKSRRRISPLPLSPSRIKAPFVELAHKILGVTKSSHHQHADSHLMMDTNNSRGVDSKRERGAVQALCRQSLIVDVSECTDDDDQQRQEGRRRESSSVVTQSCPSSPVGRQKRVSSTNSAVDGRRQQKRSQP